MKPKTLIVSETFYSIQGEGQTMGVPAVFLRLAGCNLLCSSPIWVCDTIEVWKKGVSTDFEDVLTLEYVTRLQNGAHLVITGGEPMLYQDKIVEYITWFFQTYNFFPIIEIETNGTIEPITSMFDIVEYWNCSPKLSNSGESASRRINESAIEAISLANNSIFKFVISSESDIKEIFKDYGHIVDMDRMVLMPAGESQEKLKINREFVANQCIELGVRFSDRLHINIWNLKTGV